MSPSRRQPRRLAFAAEPTPPSNDEAAFRQALRSWDETLTTGGKIAALAGLSMFLSALPWARPSIGGLSVHPYLIVLGFGFFHVLTHKPRIPTRRGLKGAGLALLAGLLVTVIFSSQFDVSLRIFIKWFTAAITFFVLERLIQTRRDFHFAAYGVIAAIALIALRGLYLYRLQPTYYLEVLPGIGSRNVFSLWTITPMVFGLLLTTSKAISLRMKLLLIGAIGAMTLPQVLSLSRSGWLLLAAIFLMVFATRFKLRLVIVTMLLAGVLQVVTQEIGFEGRIQSRFQDLASGTRSDSLRLELIKGGLILFLQNPLVGVSQGDLPYYLARGSFNEATSSHILYIDLLAGTGLAGTLPFIFCCWQISKRWRRVSIRGDLADAPELVRALPVLVAAIAFRALTSDEILFCPAVIFGLAILYGLYTSRPELASPIQRRGTAPSSTPPKGLSQQPQTRAARLQLADRSRV